MYFAPLPKSVCMVRYICTDLFNLTLEKMKPHFYFTSALAIDKKFK